MLITSIRATLWGFVLSFVTSCIALPATYAQPADRVWTNGKIVSVDHQNGVYEAMAVRDGRIVLVGTSDEVQAVTAARTEVVDLEGRTVLPGLIDSHTHAAEAALAEFDHREPTMETIPDVLEYVSERVDAAEPGAWIIVQQIFLTRLRERRYPTRRELDTVAPRNPVIFRTGSEAVLNTQALERFGIDHDFDAPPGSEIDVDSATNEPTGLVRGWKAVFSIPKTGNVPTDDERAEWLRKLISDYNANGITSFADRRAYEDQAELYARLRDDDKLTARVLLLRYVDTGVSADSIRYQVRQIARDPLHGSGSMVRLIGVKTYADGGMLSGTAHMLAPWGVSKMYGITEPDYSGLSLIEPHKLRAFARTAMEEGLQPTVHAVGDGAVDLVVRVYASLVDSLPIVTMRQLRPCVTHANFVDDESIRLMAAHGIVADVQPAWLYMDAAVLESHFGYDRMASFQRLRTLFDAGVVVGGGSDHMRKIGPFRSINPYSPFLGMETVVSRRARDFDGRLHPEEALTRMEAIRMYTINNAFLLNVDREIGSLERGKQADFVVLDRDILSCPVEEISDVQVLGTYIGGERIYERP